MREAAQLGEFYRQIGEGLRKLRKERNLSQDALAKLVGLTRTSLTNIESGRQHPPIHTFCDIVEQLHATYDELLPHPSSLPTFVDIDALGEFKVRDQNERTFIENAIGRKAKEPT